MSMKRMIAALFAFALPALADPPACDTRLKSCGGTSNWEFVADTCTTMSCGGSISMPVAAIEYKAFQICAYEDGTQCIQWSTKVVGQCGSPCM
jgi:hypothetical protein